MTGHSSPSTAPNRAAKDEPTALETAEFAAKCWELTYERMNTRISQLWKARFSVWTLLLAGGLVFEKDVPMYSEGAKVFVLVMTMVLVAVILYMHLRFESWQERRIRHERRIIYAYADTAHHLLRQFVHGLGPDGDLSGCRSKIDGVRTHFVSDRTEEDAKQKDPGVGGLRLWVISIVLGIGLVLIVAVRLYGEVSAGGQ